MKPDRCRPLAGLMVALGLSLVACSEEATSPGGIEAKPELATASALAPLSFRQLSAGDRHTCGVTSDSRVYCWGDNSAGQLGDGTTIDRIRPVAVMSGLRFREVSAGVLYSCGVTTENQAYCWGSNDRGQLGDGTIVQRLTPVAVLGGLNFRQVDAGVLHSCGVTTSDAAYCWGSNRHGRLGADLTSGGRRRPTAVAGGLQFRRVSTSGSHACGVTRDNRAFCWGENDAGQLGTGSEIDAWTPKTVRTQLRFSQIDADLGGFGDTGYSCGITTDDRAFCWGLNVDGQLGNGTQNQGTTRPTAVRGGLLFKGVKLGVVHTCGVTPENKAYCWGQDGNGQLGNGSPWPDSPNRPAPFPVAGNISFKAMAPGGSHSCGLATDGRAYCWGWNGDGQLGTGTRDRSSTPVPVVGPS